MNGMKRIWIVLVAFTAAAADLPKAEILLEKYIEATGGRANYEKRTSEYLAGTVEMPAAGVKGTLEGWSEAPNSLVMVMEIDNIGKMETGTNGVVAWENSAVMGPRVRAGAELRFAIREALFNAPIHWKKLFKKVETKGDEPVEGVDCYKVVLTPTEGKPETWFIEKDTSLVQKMVRSELTSMGEVNGELIFKDYKPFDGVLSPTTLIQKAAGQEIRMKIDAITPNVKIPKSKFAPPAEVKQLLQKKAA